ncbi:MAG: helicase HerA-like C-terminal domain-containing protein [Burkholderiaceae bacterium]
MPTPLLIARAGQTDLNLLPALANRHGLITGATGTGKTISLQVLAERFSCIGVPVFMADVKGDLTGISQAGTLSTKLKERIAAHGLPEPELAAMPVTLWDVFGEKGHPLRATVSDMGPVLLARLLGLNETQEGVLNLVFRIADEQGLLLLDAKDLRAMIKHVGDNAREFTTTFGNISSASIGAIQRNLLVLEQQGVDRFFGEPMLDLADLMQTDAQGRGVVNILAADRLMSSPRLYATFLLWLLSELFEKLPEVGDPDKPRLVFFFDEAHLLFNEAPKALLEKVEQVVRLIRSKGVGVYFITQNPLDVPETVLGQLGNRVQHALRAFTPRDQKAVRSAAQTMRANPAFSTETAIMELGVGEALVSLLDEKGRPCMVERAWIVPPGSRIGPVNDTEREALLKNSIVAGVYDTPQDRESAFERLQQRTSQNAAGTLLRGEMGEPPRQQGGWQGDQGGSAPSRSSRSPASRGDTVLEAIAKSAARSIGSSVGRAIVRGVLGGLLGGSRRR